MNWQAAALKPAERIIVALDRPNAGSALSVVAALSPHPVIFKIGLQLYTAAGPEIVRAVQDRGGRVFLDLKLHDIPHTVARAVESAGSLGVEMLTLHLSGGGAMIRAATEVASEKMLLLGVTVLTSSDESTLEETGISSSMEEQVLRLARLGTKNGIVGVVASPLEIEALRHAHGDNLKIVTPGIRPAGAALHDQKRALTPTEAFKAGADFLVIGRPITEAENPRAALEQILQDVV